jgi:hypothetical protein
MPPSCVALYTENTQIFKKNSKRNLLEKTAAIDLTIFTANKTLQQGGKHMKNERTLVLRKFSLVIYVSSSNFFYQGQITDKIIIEKGWRQCSKTWMS